MTDCSVVIPVYQSADSLPELIERLAQALPTIATHYEVLLVNDGSPDASWQVITGLAAKYPWVHGLDLMRNYGQHNALLAGIRAVQYPVTVTMDDDLQHPPDQIPLLLARLDEGYDVVYGTPLHQQHGFWRDLSSSLTKFVMRSTTGLKVASDGSSFRAFRTVLREAFANYASPSVSIDVLLTWGTTRLGAVKVRHDPRRRGKSNYNLIKLIALAIDMTTGFSTWPLRLASLIGFAVTLLGMLLFLFLLVEFLITRGPLSLYRFIAAVVAIFSGAQLFGMGIIGEYLARMHYRMMARPTFTIRQRTQTISESEVIPNV
ncbi:MAG: glycosyltransferase family 2 protein [Anaerolineae bacterium]